MLKLPSLLVIASLTLLQMTPSDSCAQDSGDAATQSTGQPSQSKGKYSPEVVVKADKILEGLGLKRSGKTIRALDTAEVGRELTAISRQRRELRNVQMEWKKANNLAVQIRAEIKRLDLQHGELNLQLARVAGRDTAANNRIVGLINATSTKIRAMADEEQKAKNVAAEKRVKLNRAEKQYAETVLAIRRDFSALKQQIDTVLEDANVQIALKVMHQNFGSPEQVTSTAMLKTLEKKIEKIEQEVFSESIPLDVQSGSLYVNVVVGAKSARMVVDSGATLISLPARTAVELGVEVPLNARQLRLIMADGREIPARRVTLDRVRVGEFEAENVDAAVLDPAAVGAEPLLGMSYLGNFKFEIDSADKSLKMLRVSTD